MMRDVGPYLLPVSDTTGSLLSVSTSKLITDLWSLSGSHPDLTEPVSIIIDGQHNLVHYTVLTSSHEHTGVSLRVALSGAL